MSGDLSRGVSGEVFAPRQCDDEVANLMDRLDRLQTWLMLKCTAARGDREYLAAHRLIQDTRGLLVERLHGPNRHIVRDEAGE